MKKKLGAMITAGVMACTLSATIALSACGGSAKPTFDMPEEGFDNETPITITFYHTMGATLREVLDKYITRFNAIYPNITVEHVQAGGYDDVRERVMNELSAEIEPNIAYCYSDHVADYNRAGAVQPLNDFLYDGFLKDEMITLASGEEVHLGLTEEETDMFIEGYYEEGFGFGNGDYMYTLPFSKSTEVLYYNKTFFKDNREAIGTDLVGEDGTLKSGLTWDEMEDICKKILAIDPTCIPLGYDSEANWFITMCEQLGTPYTSATGDHYLFDNEANYDFVERFRDWHQKGYVTTQAIYGSYTSGLFTNLDPESGKRGYMCIGSSAGANNQRPDKVGNDYAFEVGIATIPQEHPENPKVISQGPSVCIFKKDNPQEVLASWLFLKYLTTNVGFQAEFAVASGYVPVLKQEYMTTNQVYADHLAEADGKEGLTALAALVCMQQQDAYYTSPVFSGSATAREQVGLLMQNAFTTNDDSKTARDIVKDAFKKAYNVCEYGT